jgi:hypothetical protein
MRRDAGSERWVAGQYELVGLSGALLPVRALAVDWKTREVTRCRITAGALRLQPDCTYVLELASEHDGMSEAIYTQLTSHAGTWRFVPSGLDDTSGSVLFTGANGTEVVAAVTGASLVHYAPMATHALQWTPFNWVYLRRTA